MCSKFTYSLLKSSAATCMLNLSGLSDFVSPHSHLLGASFTDLVTETLLAHRRFILQDMTSSRKQLTLSRHLQYLEQLTSYQEVFA
ncbi:hypothetical protein PVAP13_8KG148000 [Panicum virgatum]|uniref:Uncharacterized protein n=1 Tax=Panicum virgatum TaxID=38727 RepID=A0A8T0PLT1_PANVG|nr:hypothetical protein PVAP13_8KG148000 [Panicum virgatum]